MTIKKIGHSYPSASSPITAGHVDYVYRENGEDVARQSPQQACEEGCLDAFFTSFRNGCSTLRNIDNFFSSCEARCETLMKITYQFIPTETDNPRFYRLIGYGIGQKILEEDSLNSLSKCSAVSPSPVSVPATQPALNSASSENQIIKYVEEGLLLGAVTLVSYSVLTKVAWLSKMNVGANLLRGEFKYAKAPAFSTALARRSYFLKA